MAERKNAAESGEDGKTETREETSGPETGGEGSGGTGEPGTGDTGTGEPGTGDTAPGHLPGEGGASAPVPSHVDEEVDPAEKALAVNMFVQEILAAPAFVEGVHAIVAGHFKTLATSELAGMPSMDMTAAVEQAVRDLVDQGVIAEREAAAIKARDEQHQADHDKAAAAAHEKAAAKRRKEAEAAEAKRIEDERKALAEATESLESVKRLERDADDEDVADLRSGDALGILRFGDDEKFLTDMAPIVVPSDKLSRAGGRVVVDLDVAFLPEIAPAKITDAWLFSEDAAIRCEIPAGLNVGGGRHAKIPTGSLAF